MSDHVQAAEIERLRRLLFEGGYIDMGKHGVRQLDPPLALAIAQEIHTFEVAQWEASGSGDLRPALRNILRRARVYGMLLPESAWLDAAARGGMTDQDVEPLREQLLREDVSRARPTLMPDPGTQIFTARDVARLRRELVPWLDTYGSTFYAAAIASGEQSVFMSDTRLPRHVALARAEASAMAEADLYYIDADMCQLLANVCPSMPPIAPTRGDLPSDYGFAAFASPLAAHHNWRAALDAPPGINEDLLAGPTQIVGASWRPHSRPGWDGDGVWFTFYALTPLRDDSRAARRARRMGAEPSVVDIELFPENELLTQWFDPESHADEARFLMTADSGTTAGMGRVLLAAFHLARQPRVGQIDTEQVLHRPKSKSQKRRGVKQAAPDAVRVVRLQPRPQTTQPDTDVGAELDEGRTRQYRHRWLVGGMEGFWRNQWYPKEGRHRPILIAPYIKGPKGAPLLVKETVTRVSPALPTPRSGIVPAGAHDAGNAAAVAAPAVPAVGKTQPAAPSQRATRPQHQPDAGIEL